MLKFKNILKTTLVAAMAVTTLTAAAVPASADCTGWIVDGAARSYCDYSSGWCEIFNPQHSYLTVYTYHRVCDKNNKEVTEYKYENIKTGCCS